MGWDPKELYEIEKIIIDTPNMRVVRKTPTYLDGEILTGGEWKGFKVIAESVLSSRVKSLLMDYGLGE